MVIRSGNRVPAFGPALMLAVLAAPVLVGMPAPAFAEDQPAARDRGLPSRDADLRLTGTITGADHQSYKRVPFPVPEGVDRLVVAFDYDAARVEATSRTSPSRAAMRPRPISQVRSMVANGPSHSRYPISGRV